MKEAEACLRDKGASVVSNSGDRFGHPRRVACEELIVLRRAQKPHDAELDHEVVDDFLSLMLSDGSRGQVARKVDIEKCRHTSQRHRGSVLFLDGRQISEINPLNCLASVRRWTRDVKSVAQGHLLEFFERANLLGEFLAIANDLFGRHHIVQRGSFLLLPFDEPLYAVKRHAPVIADDATSTVRVRQSRQYMRTAAFPDVHRISIEHRLVVRLAIFRKRLDHMRIGFVAVRLEGVDRHPEPAVRHDRAL